MTGNTPPFAAFEWMIAWRYLRARRAEGGVSAMTIISFLGIMLAVFALIATLSVRSGFRAEFVDTILGANAHVTLYSSVHVDEGGRTSRVIEDYEEMAARLAQVRGVTRVAPLIRGQVMASSDGRNTGIEVFGIHYEDLLTIPRVADPEQSLGDISRFTEGVAIGSGVARELNLSLGDSIRVISPDGARTAFGTSPRISAYEVVYIFTAGRY
ncbi:ABC transporter permease, partial [Roseinatronobacter monicus]|uniref:ABC transporter permease n=1 Tax=Roseinatronobacter monicus TaxID=393481 RepID=UPI003F38A89C